MEGQAQLDKSYNLDLDADELAGRARYGCANYMTDAPRITSVRFSRYKAFREFSLSLGRFNVLVGPNNAGKSTILGAFRILAEAIRKAKAKAPTYVQGPDGGTLGYEIGLANVPVATENVFHNYDDSSPAKVSFRISTGGALTLFFPRIGVCNLICETDGKDIKSPTMFRQKFGIEIGFVPTLGPVEHDELLYQKEAARIAILTHRASRNFRNIWHHYPESFPEFRSLIRATWPGMDIKQPEVDTTHEKPLLHMFCPEEKIDREIFWTGFGFQVWCQMLTFMVVNKHASLLIIDEPDIYLHSDLQRQLVNALRQLGPDILIATHSTEILLEADPDEVLTVTKSARSAKRLADPSRLPGVFSLLGSNANPLLTQLARTKRLVFVEGEDFRIISWFANKLGANTVAIRSGFAVKPTSGFNPTKVQAFREGVIASLGCEVDAAVVFDRDYRSDPEVELELSAMRNFCEFAHIHSRKEIENFLLVPTALERAIVERINEQSKRSGKPSEYSDHIEIHLIAITDAMKNDVLAQYLKRQQPYEKSIEKGLDDATITSRLLHKFELKWRNLQQRLEMVPGKEVLSRLNTLIQDNWSITITPNSIIQVMTESEVPEEMKGIIASLEAFARKSPGIALEN